MTYVPTVNCRWGMLSVDRNDQGLDSGGARETALGFNVDVALVTVSHQTVNLYRKLQENQKM